MEIDRYKLQRTFWKWFGSDKIDRWLTVAIIMTFLFMVVLAIIVSGS